MSRTNLLFTQTTFASQLIINGDEYAAPEDEEKEEDFKSCP